MTSLKATLDNHNNVGGTYTVLTPAYMYENLIMTSLTDNSRGNNSLPQNAWRFDFEKPLVSLADIESAQNQLMSKITNGTPTDANQSGVQPGTTTPQSSLSADPNSVLYTSPTAIGTAIDYTNFPATINAANFSFNGIA